MKIIGYIIAILGLASLALTTSQIRKAIPFQLPPQITTTTLTIVGVVLIIIGILFSFKKSSSTSKAVEVPIYQGNQIVGYRRT